MNQSARHLRVVAEDERRHPRDPDVWQPGLAAAREALAASQRPAPLASAVPIDAGLREPPDVLVERALEALPDIEACRSALEALLELAERLNRVSIARAARRALVELGEHQENEPDGGEA